MSGRRGRRERMWMGAPWAMPGGGARARRGDVRAAILALLAEEPRNGYQIIQELARRTDGVWQPSPGSVYPALQQLEDEDLVRQEERDGKRLYALTDAGRAHVDEHRDEIGAPWEKVAEGATGGGADLRDAFRQLAIAFGQLAHAGSEAQVTKARTVLDNARKALYRILAGDE